MKKALIAVATASVVVITALVVIIVYLLKNGDFSAWEAPKIWKVVTAWTSQEDEMSEESVEPETVDVTEMPQATPQPTPQPEQIKEPEEADTEAADPETIDVDSMIDKSAGERPQKWYGSYESSGPVEKTIDLKDCKSKCPDIYAWIEIPGTDIDYPIAYCENSDDPFWFSHNMYGNPDKKGMIITDSLNSMDFMDPVTIIYGHNPDDDTMFAQLHAFRDPGFFEEHDHVNIYTDDAELVYRIYACYTGSAEHILLNNDFSDPTGFSKYFDSIGDMRDLSMNIREGSKPSFDDHVITLVTHCDDDDKRLFVHAVLDEVRY